MHHCFAGRYAYYCGIVWIFQTDDNVVIGYWMQLAECARQYCRANFGTAATAAHGDGGNRL